MLRLRRVAITGVFFLSGATGLIYEVLWVRHLHLVFGATTYAIATVLATFMGGLAFGSWLLGRWGDHRINPLYAYAALEAAIGIYALFTPMLLESLTVPYVALRQLNMPIV